MDLVETPNFDFIEKNGVKANSLKPIFPSFTFPNHYSIATGCYTDKHGILGNVFYDFNRNQTYSNLNLVIRLTRVKRLSRKRCCDTTPDRCQEGCQLTILSRIS